MADGLLPAAGGDDFAAWVAPHLAVLAALAVREVGASDAEDVVQETLLRAWRRRSTYRAERGSPRAWLVAVLLDRARRHRVRGRSADLLEGDHAASGHGSREDAVDLDRAVRRLSPRQREVVTLHYLADLPVAEVATVLGISAGSVKSHLHDARANLRADLERS